MIFPLQNALGPLGHRPYGVSGIHERWDNLFGGWILDEESDGSVPVTRVDVLGGRDLTDVNTVPSVTDGTLGEVADFDKANLERLIHAPVPSWAMTTGGGVRTISAWVRPDEEGSFAVFVDQWTTGQKGSFSVYRHPSSEQIICQVVDTGGSQKGVESTDLCPLNAWAHLVVWYDTDSRLYLTINDGTPKASAAFTLADIPGTMPDFCIGSRQANYCAMGQIADVYLFPDVKDADWRAGMRNGGAGRSYPK